MQNRVGCHDGPVARWDRRQLMCEGGDFCIQGILAQVKIFNVSDLIMRW